MLKLNLSAEDRAALAADRDQIIQQRQQIQQDTNATIKAASEDIEQRKQALSAFAADRQAELQRMTGQIEMLEQLLLEPTNEE